MRHLGSGAKDFTVNNPLYKGQQCSAVIIPLESAVTDSQKQKLNTIDDARAEWKKYLKSYIDTFKEESDDKNKIKKRSSREKTDILHGAVMEYSAEYSGAWRENYHIRNPFRLSAARMGTVVMKNEIIPAAFVGFRPSLSFDSAGENIIRFVDPITIEIGMISSKNIEGNELTFTNGDTMYSVGISYDFGASVALGAGVANYRPIDDAPRKSKIYISITLDVLKIFSSVKF